jgi:hypothetical protein
MWEAPQGAEFGEPLIERPLHWVFHLIEKRPSVPPYMFEVLRQSGPCAPLGWVRSEGKEKGRNFLLCVFVSLW